jgi:glycosyltransferase involved in cell wall biosynthesis
MQEHPSFCVLVCVHSDDRFELAVRAVQSAVAQTFQPDEIIVVSDHNPSLAERLGRYCPQAQVIANAHKKGLSGARNTGWEAARSDVIAFLDDDAQADPEWLARLSAHYANPCVMGVGGAVKPDWQGRQPRWFPDEFNWVVGCSYRGLPSKAQTVRNLIGCNMSFRRDVIAMLGGFREDLGRDGANGSGCEETDLCIRASRMFADWHVVYDPDISVRHHVAAYRATLRYFLQRCLAEGRSKAIVVARNGGAQGLSSERHYIWKTLPSGIACALADVFRGDISGLSRAGALAAGLLQTMLGYVQFRFLQRRQSSSADHFQPLPIVELNLDEPATGRLLGANSRSSELGGVFVLVKKNGRPAATVELPAIRPLHDTQMLRWLLSSHVKRGPVEGPTYPLHPVPVSVIVATRNRPAQLSRCLESLTGQNYPDFEIIVVDNAPSDDKTSRLIGDRFNNCVRYVRELRPGLAHAHNAGVAVARHELLAFTDDDVICDRGWLAAIVSAFESGGDDVGCVTGLILPMELETRAQYWTECHGGFAKGFHRRRFDLRSEPAGPDMLYPLTAGQFGSGAAMAFRRAALENIGSFDPALGAGTKARGGDDLNSFALTILAGQAIVYEPAAITWHQHRRDETGMQRQAFNYGVGLGAYLTSVISRKPHLIWHFSKGFPSGIAHMMSASSPKLARLPKDFPSSFVWLERIGILYGPFAYFNSRRSLTGTSTHWREPLTKSAKLGVETHD